MASSIRRCIVAVLVAFILAVMHSCWRTGAMTAFTTNQTNMLHAWCAVLQHAQAAGAVQAAAKAVRAGGGPADTQQQPRLVWPASAPYPGPDGSAGGQGSYQWLSSNSLPVPSIGHQTHAVWSPSSHQSIHPFAAIAVSLAACAKQLQSTPRQRQALLVHSQRTLQQLLGLPSAATAEQQCWPASYGSSPIPFSVAAAAAPSGPVTAAARCRAGQGRGITQHAMLLPCAVRVHRACFTVNLTPGAMVCQDVYPQSLYTRTQ